ncbi:hypothetical protein SDC9_63039 [bioreactor metagenome]|jgi:hypothetical protein|uniref:Permease family protein n=2 Tax=root TaxID=1 RepID=A0A562J0T5_9FIRM|nr:hypothetical protein [Sedimentibacter saalensis]MEA5096900.1 hypothetical protein [Sedimentibacter saalensis]TWH76434.1 hypothetical protein LY60_03608 [Sedimentibacter saalensis]
MSAVREYGKEQPYIPAGIFKIRLPFIHYKWEWSEFFQAILMCATCLGAIPVLTEVLGVSNDIAWSMVIINSMGYVLHSLLGDPVVPGWITPSIPLTIAFLSNYIIGPERTQALIALQFEVGIIFVVFGITGIANKVIHIVPTSIKAGILLGAGVAAIYGEFKTGGRFGTYPIAVTIGVLVAFYLLFSQKFRNLRKTSKFANALGKYGMLPAVAIAIIVGPLAGELPFPNIQMGSFIKIPDLAGIMGTLSPFSIGFPSAAVFLQAIPMAVMAYIIAFGDFVTSETLIREADEARPDEKVDFNANRSNLISGIRNIIQSLISPYTQLSGPLWAAVTASVSQRYKDGRDAMDSLVGGMGTFRWTSLLMVAIVPIVSLVQPVLPVALSLTLLVQGYICTRLAMDMCETEMDKGIAGVMGTVIVAKSAAWGLAVGIILHLLLSSKKTAEVEEIEELEELAS